MKKVIFLSLLVSSLIAYTNFIHAMEEVAIFEQAYASPVISLGQLTNWKNQFIAWTNKYYRCLIGGRCTHSEINEVKTGLAKWGKRLGLATLIAGLAAIGHYKAIPMVKQYAQEQKAKAKKEFKEYAEEVAEMLSRQMLTTLEVALVNVKFHLDPIIEHQRTKLYQDLDALQMKSEEMIGSMRGSIDEAIAKIRQDSLKEVENTTISLLKKADVPLGQISEVATLKATEILRKQMKDMKIRLPLGREISFSLEESPEIKKLIDELERKISEELESKQEKEKKEGKEEESLEGGWVKPPTSLEDPD